MLRLAHIPTASTTTFRLSTGNRKDFLIVTQEDLSDQDSANDLSDEFDDVFYGPGFVMARKGRFIFTESTLSKDEHRELLETFASYREGLDESIERQVQELEEILSELNPLDVIGNIALINSILDPETYKEYSHKGSDIYTEYISLLCLTKPREAYPRESEEPISGPVLEEIQERAEDLLRDTVMYYAFKDIDPDRPEPPDALTRLRFSILSRSFLVRYMTYHHHKVDVLRGIFGPLEDELRTALGFSIEDALVQVYGIESLVNQRLVERREESRGFEKWARKAIKRYRQKKREDSEIPLDILTELASMRPSGSAEVIRNWAIGRMFFRLGDALSFSSADLARETGISEERIEAFLKRMSLKFGGNRSGGIPDGF